MSLAGPATAIPAATTPTPFKISLRESFFITPVPEYRGVKKAGQAWAAEYRAGICFPTADDICVKSSIKAVGCKTITALLFLVVVFFRLSFSQALKDTSLCQILEKDNVLTMEEWDVREGKIFCVITAQIDTKSTEGDTIPFQRLSFYKDKDGRLTKIHEFEEMNFLNMFHLYDGNFMTIWMSGSAAFVKIFAVDSVGKIKLVLDEGVKQMPEFAEIGGGEKAATAILLSSGSAFEKGSDFVYPESTDIFKWNGTSYELIKAVPWKTRFKALEKMQ